MALKLQNWFSAVLLWLSLSTLPIEPALAERIADFKVDIDVKSDGLMQVVETIKYDFGKTQRHGIFRRIPVQYTRKGHPYDINLDVLSVTEEGRALPYESRNMAGIQSIKIGAANVLVTGPHTYRISYAVRRAVTYFGQIPEVYWNAVGRDWPCPIDQVEVNVTGPAGIDLSKLKTVSYIGTLGSRTHGIAKSSKNAIVFSGKSLKPGQDLSVVVAFPRGSIVLPSPWLGTWQQLIHWRVGILIPAATAALLIFLWMFWGIDEGKIQAIPVEWNPPKELTPAEVGTLIDEKCDNYDLTSTVLDLAARGYLRIRQIPYNGILGMDNKDYEFRKTLGKPEDRDLKQHERLLLGAFFASGPVTYLSALTGSFKDQMETMRTIIYDGLVKDGYFSRNPKSDRDNFLAIGFFIMAFGTLLLLAGYLGGDVYKHYGFGIALSGLMIMGSSGVMPKRTAKGVAALQQILAFERFATKAEKKRLEVLAKEDPTIFGRLLPYAVVLGLSHQWADAFKDLIQEQPDWYVTTAASDGHVFNSNDFAFDLCYSMNTMNSSFNAAPLPSNTYSSYSSGSFGSGGAGGGFSGFGGGGFSGGGFGGGGGGSW